MSLVKHCLAFSAVLALTLPSLVLGAPSSRARIVQEGPNGFTLRVTIPEPIFTPVAPEEGGNYHSVAIPGLLPGSGAQAGLPDLPQEGFPFGLPEGATARIAGVRSLVSTSRQGASPLPVPHRRVVPGEFVSGQEESYTPDPAAYGSRSLFPSQLVELSPTMGWRHQRVQTLLVNPVQVTPATGHYSVTRELEIEVRFETKEVSGERREPVVVDAPGWDETMDRSLINPVSARTFRSRPSRPLLTQVTQAGEVHLRLRIGESGLARIPFADLEGAGWPADVPVSEVRLEERSYDKNAVDPFVLTNLPRIIEDTNQNSIFDTGDFLVFYGFNFFDRFNPQIKDSRYSYYHAYWVSAGVGGMDPPVVDGYPAGSYTPVLSYPHAKKFEENLVYRNEPLDSGASIFPIFDSLYWLDERNTTEDLVFEAVNLDVTGTFRVRARWQGRSNDPPNHFLSLDVNGKNILDDSLSVARFEFKFDSDMGVPLQVSDYLVEGNNTLTVRATDGRPLSTFSGITFDWFEISHDRLFKAVNDELFFNSGGGSGLMEISVSGFSSPDVIVLDVTDPQGAFRLTPLIEDVGGLSRVTIRFDAGAGRRFYATVRTRTQGLPPTAHVLPPDLGDGEIAMGLPRDLLVEGAGSDYILITHPDFEDAWAPLVAHRQSLGHQVFVCDVWEVYDQFGGGHKTPWAIQRFLTQAYRTWDPSPSFLLLGGDASEDYRTDTGRADPDWVPTMMHFGNVPGTVGLELAGTDTWYAAFLREGDRETDVLPEMHVGRIPTGTAAETQDVVQKILDYEAMDPGDDWRKRGLFVADDEYSNNILSSSPYCRQASEVSFRTTTQAVCDSIRDLGRITDFTCEILFLADYLDTVSTLGRNPGAGLDCPTDSVTNASLLAPQTFQYTRANVTPVLLDALNRGHLIWEFTGHGNKNQMTHESLFLNNVRIGTQQDVAKVNNFGKPFLFMGYACHLAEFEGFREKTDGESIGEHLLLAPNRGAIAVMASTGYEWLHTNPIVQVRTSRPLFWDLPRDPATGRPRRLFGEAMTRGLAGLVMEQPSRKDFVGMMRTYASLADPALRVDIHTSSFQVEVDGNTWNNGAPLSAGSFLDTLTVTAVISDDVDVSSIRVFDGATEIPSSALSLVEPDSSTKGLQTYSIAFETTVKIGTYDVVIDAPDWSGRESRFVMPVTLDVDFLSEGEPMDLIASQNIVDPLGSIGIEVRSPVPLTENHFEVLLDDVPIEFSAVPQTPNEWEIALSRGWENGDHVLQIRISDPVGGTAVRSVGFTVSSGPLTMSSLFFYPNPVEGNGGSLVYTLNRIPASVQISIYSVSGRRVLREEVMGRAGTNTYRWDLRDQRGDPVANGIYLMVLRLEGSGGELITSDGREHDGKTLEVQRIAVTR